MTSKIGTGEEFSEIQQKNPLKSTYYGIYIVLNVFYLFIFKLKKPNCIHYTYLYSMRYADIMTSIASIGSN